MNLTLLVGIEQAIKSEFKLGNSISVTIVMGAITGVAGGMIRDVLCNVIPMILRQEIYATATILTILGALTLINANTPAVIVPLKFSR